MPREFLPRHLPQIMVPFRTAVERYGPQVAKIMEKLAASRASQQIRDQRPHDLRWYYTWEQAGDPSTRNVQEFVDHLCTHSVIYLVGIGMRWKSWEKLPTVPPQVQSRFIDRARLICNASAELMTEPAAEVKGETSEPLSVDIGGEELLKAFADWAMSHPEANHGLVRVVEFALRQLLGS